MPILNADFAVRFAQDWIAAWNQHDLEAILSHYADDLELSSPLIPAIAAVPSGILQGKAAVRAYWEKGLAQIPDLHFELRGVLPGIDSLTLYYQGHRGPVAEVLWFNAAGKVQQAAVYYAIDFPNLTDP